MAGSLTMIAQILNRQFMLDQMELVLAALPRLISEESRRGPDAENFTEAATELTAAHEREVTKSSGQQGYDDTDARRGQAPPLLDDMVFLSHDPVVSVFQSALEEYFEEKATGVVESEPPPDDARRADGFVAVTDRRIAGLDPLARAADGRRLFDKFGQTDPRWVASAFARGVQLLRGRRSFNPRPADPLRISNDARLILVGDWATGIHRAIEVGKQMRLVVDQGKRTGIEQHVIHLGDVYYSGQKREYEKNFLPHWPVYEGEGSAGLASWCLNGNHDMDSGGHGYFGCLLAEPRFARQQQSSFFSLHNDHWDILGLDTAYEDEGLCDPQAAWMQEVLGRSQRRSMLLSHHQLFSAYEHPCEPLQKKVSGFLARHPVDAWFWGHEHRCVFYSDHHGVRNARLIGNGGVPVYMTHSEDSPHKPPSFYEYREYIQGFLEKWAILGFAVVDLRGPKAEVRYIDEFGTKFVKPEVL